ncbi:carotenoid 9,10(9',10')-cleavage dioxygenase 1-like isoform X2 [Syzygium oleosum]|uniref:carotenoid 9,10(9',10')-cleavage dioxygenase 1-like isoform X2 n=1 Tax=Syzygium oleosum TaxID=219896 RepID=UPI0024BB2518|nr:carotenoid 9,10(9',10')-cleavage dioxygenase 1-like isoform X2 [Syzygium oleosum]
MALSSFALQVNASNCGHSISPNVERLKTSIYSPALQPCSKDPQRAPLRVDFPSAIKIACSNALDALVSLVFEFMDQPLLPSQRNFAPVSELGEAIKVDNIEGKIPDDFPVGVYVRNGPNPLFEGLKSTKSIFGRSSHTWIDGEGMLHAVYIDKDSDGRWIVQYNNRHVETETYKQEKQRNRPSFLPAIEGDPPAILSAYLLNLRFGTVNKLISNTNVFEHGGKFYSIAENHMPQEIDIFTLETRGNWNVDRDWNRPFTSHPKRAPGTGELVIMGVDAVKPFMELGIISADGKKLLHKADLKLNRCSLCHEIGVTQRYNVIMDFPLTIDINRLVRGGPLIQFNKKEYARIGIMPRYGDGNSMRWFDVETSCMFHILNCFEDGDEVVVRGCRALESIIPGPDFGLDKFQWFSKRLKPIRSSEENVAPTTEEEEEGSLFSRAYEWRLNMITGEADERNLTGTKYSMDFPMINSNFTGLKNKFGYTQVVDSSASSISGMPKYGGLAKLYLDEPRTGISSKEDQFEDAIKLEYHEFGENIFCTGAAFVPKENGFEEDDGWIITFVHNESTNTSQVNLIDCKNFSGKPVAKITLPCRVPYGFHGAFISQPKQIDLQA